MCTVPLTAAQLAAFQANFGYHTLSCAYCGRGLAHNKGLTTCDGCGASTLAIWRKMWGKPIPILDDNGDTIGTLTTPREAQ